MKIYHKYLLKKEYGLKENTLWYTLGNLCSSATSVLLMIIVTRVLGVNEAGIFAISYSIAQLMLTIGWFGTRSFQVSDVREEFSFSDYLNLKIILSIVILAGGIIYSICLRNYGYKLLVSALYCVLILGDVFADIFAGRFQQIDKLYLAGMSYTIRNICYCIIFLLSLLITKELIVGLCAAIVVSFTVLMVFDYPMIKETSIISFKVDFVKIIELVRACFPLFISSFVTTFIMNIPKNAIEVTFSQNIQAYYNIIFTPSSLVNMFCMFIFVPLYTSIAKAWNGGEIKVFKKIIFRIVLMVFGLSVVVLIGGALLGIPILEFVYGVQLMEYKIPFLVLVGAGCVNGLNTVWSYIFTVVRRQKYVLVIYVISLVFSQILITPLISRFGVTGASVDYLFGIVVICILFSVIFVFKIPKKA
ncbi:lipopolysaccharide biosynthesis protein [Merdimonas faecis]|uniref:lipopolysaccharide biosynthesis protein n=1 Tax=Merdimonas faecis TaxID=1653435 RepID=UPI0022E5E9DF|nr:oligosaccharide flippase family protein [Merdimonas faecis]